MKLVLCIALLIGILQSTKCGSLSHKRKVVDKWFAVQSFQFTKELVNEPEYKASSIKAFCDGIVNYNDNLDCVAAASLCFADTSRYSCAPHRSYLSWLNPCFCQQGLDPESKQKLCCDYNGSVSLSLIL